MAPICELVRAGPEGFVTNLQRFVCASCAAMQALSGVTEHPKPATAEHLKTGHGT
jgi:hypothetical protein